MAFLQVFLRQIIFKGLTIPFFGPATARHFFPTPTFLGYAHVGFFSVKNFQPLCATALRFTIRLKFRFVFININLKWCAARYAFFLLVG